jgi:hypothetical protein
MSAKLRIDSPNTVISFGADKYLWGKDMVDLKAQTKNALITKNLWQSMFGAGLGFAAAIFPVGLTWVAIDTDASATADIRETMTAGLLGLWQFAAGDMMTAVPEVLLCAVALGVAAGIAWWESVIGERSLGRLAGAYAALSVIGALISLFLFFVLHDQAADKINPNHIKYISASYNVLFGSIIFYFLSILQIRRVKDARAKK